MPAPFGIFAAHKMTAADAMSEDFTGSSDFDSFAQTLMGFLFWHLIGSFPATAWPSPRREIQKAAVYYI